jgi:GntR family transcriptional regulator
LNSNESTIFPLLCIAFLYLITLYQYSKLFWNKGHPKTMEQSYSPHQSRLSTETGVPLYRQLQEILSGQIHSGALVPGDLVPGEMELAHRFDVSRITARRALTELANGGLVTRRRGLGTIVIETPPMPYIRSSVEGWLDGMRQMAEATTVRLLSFEYAPASKAVSQAMALDVGTTVQRAVRVRLLGDQPFSYLDTSVPEHIGRRYDRSEMGAMSLLELLENAGVRVASAQQAISAVAADAEVASALSIYAGAPLLSVSRVVMDENSEVVEFIRALYRPEIYTISMNMERVERAEGKAWSAGDRPFEDRATHD